MTNEEAEENIWKHPVVQAFMDNIDKALMHSRAYHDVDDSIPVPAARLAIKTAQLEHLDGVYNSLKVGFGEDELMKANMYYGFAKECIEHNMASSVVPDTI